MSLERYRHPRMIVLDPRSTAYEAARAMADNHIGAVLVGEAQKVVGIVTDRDLSLEVVAQDLDARTTTLREIMTDDVTVLPVSAAVSDAVQVMRTHGCRRVPLVENGRPVGLVTLDELLVDGAVTTGDAASVVAAQLEAPARFKQAGAIHPEEPARPGAPPGRVRALTRRLARAELAYARLLAAVERHTGIQARDRAELALTVVLGNLCRRVTPQEARHLIAQLPSKLHGELDRFLDGPDKRISTVSIEAELASTLHVEPDVASVILSTTCEAIADSVSAGEIEAFRGQLPLSMKDLFPPTPVRKAV